MYKIRWCKSDLTHYYKPHIQTTNYNKVEVKLLKERVAFSVRSQQFQLSLLSTFIGETFIKFKIKIIFFCSLFEENKKKSFFKK